MPDPIDLRSDFLSRPTPEMIRAMSAAATQPVGFALREDPTERALEARAAELLGKEDALFCPTCTMANQVAIHIRCKPGDSVIAESSAHVVTTEGASAVALSSILFRTVPGRLGRIDPAAVAAAIRADDAQRSRARLVVSENTHVRSGGTVVPLEEMRAVRRVAVAHGLPVHLDGSRLFNAAAYLGVRGDVLAATADSVAVNLNKGLGAPLGAVLAGPADFIKEAVRVRNLFGGSWRPANIPAAAGLVALDTMIERIGEDHVVARRIADGLAGLDGIAIDPDQVQTNIVLARIVRPGLATEDLVAALARHGLRTREFTPGVLRLVTYHQIGPAEADRVVEAFRLALAERPAGGPSAA